MDFLRGGRKEESVCLSVVHVYGEDFALRFAVLYTLFSIFATGYVFVGSRRYVFFLILILSRLDWIGLD